MTSRATSNAPWLLALVALWVALWIPRLEGPLDLRYDAGVYYVLGTSLAEGRGYRLLNEPGQIHATQYPPLLPALAALHERLLGTSDPVVAGHALRITFFVLSTCYLIAVFALARRFLAPGWSFLVALVTLLHVHTTMLSNLFFAEIPYALVTVIFFLLVGDDRRASSRSREALRQALAGLLAWVAYGLRTAGIALLAAWVGEGLLRRRWRQAALRLALALVPVLAWRAYTSHVEKGPEYTRPAYPYQRAGYQFYNVDYLQNVAYLDPFRPELGLASKEDLARRVLSNLLEMPVSLGEAVSTEKEWWTGELRKLSQRVPAVPPAPWLADVALAILSLGVVAGLVGLARRGQWLLALYVCASVLLIALTPWPGQFSRYLAPLIPFLALSFVSLVAAASRPAYAPASRPRAALSWTALAVLGLALVQQVYVVGKVHARHGWRAEWPDADGSPHPYRTFFYYDEWASQEKALEWLARRGRPGEIVATSTPQWAYLMTGEPAVMPPFETDPRAAQRLLDSVPASYLIVDVLKFADVGRRYTLPVVESYPERWELVYAAPGGSRVYRRTGADAGGAANLSPPAGSK